MRGYHDDHVSEQAHARLVREWGFDPLVVLAEFEARFGVAGVAVMPDSVGGRALVACGQVPVSYCYDWRFADTGERVPHDHPEADPPDLDVETDLAQGR